MRGDETDTVDRSYGNRLLRLLMRRLDQSGLLPPAADADDDIRNGKAERMEPSHTKRQKAGDQRPASVPAPAPLTPLDYALETLRDEAKPDALRASMAKAAMPYLHGPGAVRQAAQEVPVEEPWSALELAMHISHILMIAWDKLLTRELAAQGWDVNIHGMPYDPDAWPDFRAGIERILDFCERERNLDRPGISD